MKKSLKIVCILVVLFFVLSTICFATDINMDLDSTTSYNYSSNLYNETYDEDFEDYEDNEYNSNALTSSNMSSTMVTSTSSVQDNSLGITNILNIILIAVGIVLILLGIAILIRMRS